MLPEDVLVRQGIDNPPISITNRYISPLRRLAVVWQRGDYYGALCPPWQVSLYCQRNEKRGGSTATHLRRRSTFGDPHLFLSDEALWYLETKPSTTPDSSVTNDARSERTNRGKPHVEYIVGTLRRVRREG